MGFRSLSIEGNFSISIILVPTVQKRQNQATVRFGILTLLLNAAVLRTSSFLKSNQRPASSVRKVSADSEGNARSSQPSFSFLKSISFSRSFSKLSNFCPMPRKSVEQMSSVFLVTCVSHRIDWRIDSQTNRPKPAKTRNRAFSGYLVRKSRFWR